MTKQTQKTLAELPVNEFDAIRFRSAYSTRLRVSMIFPAVGRTKQSFKAECDINNIMSRYLKTGIVEFVNKHSPQYHDVTGLEYQDAMNIVAHSQSLFADLPSQLRAEFDNDPALFLDFVNDPANRPEMAAMGLLTPEATQALKTAAKPSEPAVVAAEATKPAAAPAEKPAAKP